MPYLTRTIAMLAFLGSTTGVASPEVDWHFGVTLKSFAHGDTVASVQVEPAGSDVKCLGTTKTIAYHETWMIGCSNEGDIATIIVRASSNEPKLTCVYRISVSSRRLNRLQVESNPGGLC